MPKIRKHGWNTSAALAGPFWYMSKGMVAKGLFLLLITLATLGIGLIPVWIYCGLRGNADHYNYLKSKGIYIY